MLCRLEVSNYALIENVDLTFEKGFTVITGETGAGKSILLKALNLLLGDRADTTVLKQSANKCYLEATFDISKLQLQDFFSDNELDFDKQCIVRREFTSAGKSRCFINDTPVQVNVLKELGDKLISIHSQHQTLALFESEFQFDVLDNFAGTESQVTDYQKKFKEFKLAQQKLSQLQQEEAQNRKERDYKLFLFSELEQANLDKLDVEKLQSTHTKIQHAEKIASTLQNANDLLESEKIGPIDSVRSLILMFDDLKNVDSKFGEIQSRLISVKVELEDLQSDVQNEMESIEFSEEEILTVKEKMDLFNALIYKHNLNAVADLIVLRDQLSNEINAIESVEKQLAEVEKLVKKQEQDLVKLANELSKKRLAKIGDLEKEVASLLSNVGMPDAAIQIDLSQTKDLTTQGIDQIDIKFKTNRGGQFLTIKKIASGGELSRLMLAILSILSKTKNLPTLIFDEIDTGVSGEVASKMAAEFLRISKKIQVVSITHLPQIAAKGSTHLHVSKQTKANKTITQVKNVMGDDRVLELAKMISGEKITDAAKENAMNLLNIS